MSDGAPGRLPKLPWYADGDCVHDANGSPVVESPWTEYGDDLRHIAAAVNATAGISLVALESGALALVLDFAVKHATAELDSSLGALQPGDEVYDALRALGRLP